MMLVYKVMNRKKAAIWCYIQAFTIYLWEIILFLLLCKRIDIDPSLKIDILYYEELKVSVPVWFFDELSIGNDINIALQILVGIFPPTDE